MTMVLDSTAGITFPDTSIQAKAANAGASGFVQSVLLTASQNTTSGTSIDFTGIPSWAKKLTLPLVGVSLSGTAIPRVQLGVGSSPTVSGYLGSSSALAGGAAGSAISNFSVGFDINSGQTNASVMQGALVFTLGNNNIWTCFGVVGQSDQARTIMVGGSISLGGALGMLRLTTSNGTDTFDAGSVTLLIEGY